VWLVAPHKRIAGSELRLERWQPGGGRWRGIRSGISFTRCRRSGRRCTFHQELVTDPATLVVAYDVNLSDKYFR
jgi:hypothetical protein